MTSPYNTRSTRSTTASAASNTVTAMITDPIVAATTAIAQRRHFCVVLTNNPRMVQSAQRMIQSVTVDVSSIEQRRQEPHVQPQVQTPVRSKRRQQQDTQPEQQVPMSTQYAATTTTTTTTTTSIIASATRAYEKQIEQDFQTQIQPILRIYLQRTRRPNPINTVFDMSNCTDV